MYLYLLAGLCLQDLCCFAATIPNATDDFNATTTAAGIDLGVGIRLPPIDYQHFRFFGRYENPDTRNIGDTNLQTLKRHYAQLPADQPIELGKTISYKKLDRQYKSTLSTRWTAKMADTPTNEEVADIVQKFLSLLDNEWQVARGASVRFTIMVDGQLVAWIATKVIKGVYVSLQAGKMQFSGATFADSAFDADVGVKLLDELRTGVKQKATEESPNRPVNKKSELKFTYENVEISILLDTKSEGVLAWPTFFWDDVQVAIRMLDDEIKKRGLHRDTWLEIKFRRCGSVVPIGRLSLVDREGLMPEDGSNMAAGAVKPAVSGLVQTS